MRSISLSVDVTNYVMLETGQPLHAFDRSAIQGALNARRSTPGETLRTLDGTIRKLDPDDLVVADDAGPLALAGVMGGASSEITEATTDVVLEAAHWDPSSIARAVRRHRLPSEAAKRFERGVDPAVAARRAGPLRRALGRIRRRERGRRLHRGRCRPGAGRDRLPGRARRAVGRAAHRRRYGRTPPHRGRLCPAESGSGRLTVRPPSWRPDLNLAADLVEEILRLEGYDTIPSALPTPPPGRGLTAAQLLRRTVSRALAAAGCDRGAHLPLRRP